MSEAVADGVPGVAASATPSAAALPVVGLVAAAAWFTAAGVTIAWISGCKVSS